MRYADRSKLKSGFTLIEILIALGLFFILVVSAIPIYGNFQSSTQLSQFAIQISQTLRMARDYSAAGYHDSSYGVYFETTALVKKKFILYQGVSYASRNTSFDRTYTLDSALSLSSTLDGNEINFAKGSALPSTTGIITLSSPSGTAKVITINSYGLVTQ